MRMRCILVLLLLCSCTFGPGAAQSQSSSEQGRKVVRRAMPVYPEIAKRMGLTGTVKLIAVVAPDGTVKDVEPVGGGPVLIQAAKDAIVKWKYAPASAETRETVEMHFNPQSQ